MSGFIRCRRVNHMNVVLRDFDAAVAHLQNLYGGEFIADMPQREWHACLIHAGRVMFEFFVPHDYLLNARYGPHYVGLEYQAEMDEVRAVLAAQNIRLVRDIGIAVHTDPRDCFGIAFEFYAGEFHEREWQLLGGRLRPAEYWRDRHPLGLTGQKAYSVAVADIDAAEGFFRRLLGAEKIYEAERPALAGRAVGLQVADTAVELQTPVAEGSLSAHLDRYGEGIRSTVFGVASLSRARDYFIERHVIPVPGGAPGSIAIPAEQNLGVIFEFAE